MPVRGTLQFRLVIYDVLKFHVKGGILIQKSPRGAQTFAKAIWGPDNVPDHLFLALICLLSKISMQIHAAL